MNTLNFLARAQALLARNPALIVLFVLQMILQGGLTSLSLQYNGLIATAAMSFALAAAHIIPAYFAYIIGDSSGLAKAPGLVSKLEFILLGSALAFVVAASFTAGLLGVTCQPFLPFVIDPTMADVVKAAALASVAGSIFDALGVIFIYSLGGLDSD